MEAISPHRPFVAKSFAVSLNHNGHVADDSRRYDTHVILQYKDMRVGDKGPNHTIKFVMHGMLALYYKTLSWMYRTPIDFVNRRQ